MLIKKRRINAFFLDENHRLAIYLSLLSEGYFIHKLKQAHYQNQIHLVYISPPEGH